MKNFRKAAAQYEFDGETPEESLYEQWMADNHDDIADAIYDKLVEDGTLFDFVWDAIKGEGCNWVLERVEKEIDNLFEDAQGQ